TIPPSRSRRRSSTNTRLRPRKNGSATSAKGRKFAISKRSFSETSSQMAPTRDRQPDHTDARCDDHVRDRAANALAAREDPSANYYRSRKGDRRQSRAGFV